MNKNPKNVILNALKHHPEGLTIQDIARFTKLNRITISKYIAVLIAEKTVIERKIGSAKLCYLKKSYNGKISKGRSIRVIPHLFLLFSLSLGIFSLPVLANVACYPSCQDCTGTDVAPCNSCDVRRMNVTAHAPDLSTYVYNMTWSSNSTATCTAGTFTNESWTNNTNYNFCPVEGAYNATINVSALDGSSYGNEGSWDGNRNNMFTLYTVNYDSDQNWCGCKRGGSTLCWNIGGETAATSCCGDDANEYNITRICSGGACTSSTSDDGCCDTSTDCIYSSTCYANGYSGDVDSDNALENCSSGTWIKGDTIPPTWQNQGTNSTTNIIPVGGAINLTAQGKDETALDWAWLSTNETNVTTNTSFKAHEDDFGSFRSAIWIGQTFTPVATSNYSIVKLLLNRTGNPTGFVVGIRNIDGTNHPTGNDLCNGTYDASLITTSSAQWYDIITSGCQLNTSTEYAMVARTSTGDASNLISWIRDDDNQYSGGEFEYSTNSGLSWTTYSGYDYLFEVYGSSFTWQNKTAYNSPMNMNDAVNTWTWSNFTWQNASIVSGTIVGWRIYYNDTSNNTNVTNVMTFCVGTCVTVADTTPPTYTSFGSNVTNYTRISSDTRIGYYALWSDNNQSGQAMNSSMRNTTSFTNGTWANWGTGNWTNYTVYPNLGNGENYTVKIYANDSSNNMNVTGTLYWMEGTAPVITISSPTNTTYLTTSVWANITLDEKGSQCFRSLDGGANTSMANSTGNWNSQMTSISLGYHKVQFYCNDTYNNNATVATQYFTVSVPIMATQWAEIKWFNYTHINISINVLTYNNHTDTISNIGVDVMQNYTDYSIASLASKATDLHIEEKQFIRPAVNDTWMNFTNITLSGQATGYSNNFTFIVPVDPPTKSEPPVGDTCECSSIQAGTVINCAENCDITTVCNANGQNIIASGSGTILLTANVINFGNINIINGCNVICNGGCFYEGP